MTPTSMISLLNTYFTQIYLQTKIGKGLWILTVLVGFIGAGYLINESYSDWLDSPISTTITTQPIDDLVFPIVTVCPPKGSHTALNYDLMKADKNSLTNKDRDDLKRAVKERIIQPAHLDYIRRMLAYANLFNLKQVYKGFYSIPKPSEEAGLKMRMWSWNGTVQTPWYGEKYREEFYNENQQYMAVIDFPPDLAKQVGSGSLMIELEVDTRDMEDWQEYVSIKKVGGILGSDKN